MLRGRAEARADVPCTTCEIYEWMRATGTWLTDDEVDVGTRPPVLLGVRIEVPAATGAPPVDVADVGLAGTSRRGAFRVPLVAGVGQLYVEVFPGPHVLTVKAGDGEESTAFEVADRPTVHALCVRVLRERDRP
jgi:hypothetical protein